MKSATIEATEEMLEFLETFTTSIIQLNLKQNDVDLIFKLCGSLVENQSMLNLRLIEDSNGMTTPQALQVTADLVRTRIFKLKSAYQREQRIISNPFYVAPKDTAIGTRWELKNMKKNESMIKVPRLIQTVFPYISMLSTIEALFRCTEFRDLYFRHNNLQNDHVCQPWKYKYFCCGNSYKKSELFCRHPHSLQLQISSDDFETCNPLASKANRHKVCAVYFTIQNLPQRFKSKVSNIYLICLCNSDDVKTKHTDFNNIWQLIVREIKYLEQTGIFIDKDTTLKGTLTQLAFDNLGANTSLGFVQSFRSHYFCRHCESSKLECQGMSTEDVSKLRTKESYNKQIDIVSESVTVKYDETKGVKYYCQLNDLSFFHIIDNPTVDIMHDICEGTIPFILRKFFIFCFQFKIFNKGQLNSMVQFHDYGFLDRKNIPSEINTDKRSLGQNAAQSLCLFRNIPFILYEYRKITELAEFWHSIEVLQRVVEIVFSYEVTDDDLDVLNEHIYLHLESVKKLKFTLIPKHHFMLHYASIIRSVGPLIHMNMFRYESKHKVFKTFVNSTQNFKNINKSIAIKHQALACTNGFQYNDDIKMGMIVALDDNLKSIHKKILSDSFGNNIENVNQLKWFSINNYEYRKNLIILHDSFLHQIHNILFDGIRHFFLCERLNILYFDSFLNSFAVDRSSVYMLIDRCSKNDKKTYEMKTIESTHFVISETLELRNQLRLPG